MRRSRACRLAGLGAGAALLLGSGVAWAQSSGVLMGNVGPGFAISLVTAEGTLVRNLAPGAYTLDVTDRGDEHNFHLTGPGVDVSTGVEELGHRTFNVSFADGQTYRYVCDVHPTSMRGSFTAGTPRAPAPRAPRTGRRLVVGTIGPGRTIALGLRATRRARTLPAGAYTIVVRDRSSRDNFHLVGPGVNRRTGVRFRGTRRWRVTLRRGAVYRYRSDARPQLRGRLRVT